MSEMRGSKSDEIKNWLNSIDGDEYEHAESICSSVIDSCSSIIESSSDTESGEEFALGERNRSDSLKCALNNDLMRIPALTFNNVSITNSTNVQLGTIYKVTGNLNINVINNEEHQLHNVNVQTSSTQQAKPTIVRHACLIYPRIRWLAMDPLSECSTLPEPVEYVVICQTATASSTESAKNVGIIRDLQTLNVESQGFDDIIYNFLIGCDGIVYEGRGWGVQGDHTNGYNHNSIGIAFVGNFKRTLPSDRALSVCHKLFTRGIAEGHLSKDFKILANGQCLTNGNALYEEVKNWDNFHNVHSENES